MMAPPDHGDDELHGYRGLIPVLEAFDKPLLAAVNGLGLGIGATILPYCDIVWIAEGARLKVPFVTLGVTTEAAGSLLLPQRMGWQAAAHFIFTADWMSAEEAVACGLAWKVSAPGVAARRHDGGRPQDRRHARRLAADDQAPHGRRPTRRRPRRPRSARTPSSSAWSAPKRTKPPSPSSSADPARPRTPAPPQLVVPHSDCCAASTTGCTGPAPALPQPVALARLAISCDTSHRSLGGDSWSAARSTVVDRFPRDAASTRPEEAHAYARRSPAAACSPAALAGEPRRRRRSRGLAAAASRTSPRGRWEQAELACTGWSARRVTWESRLLAPDAERR